jgi:SAM-dependent methyltransferase
MWRTYLRYFSPIDHLLEINCGTGTDALFLAEKGLHVLATDDSPDMVAAASAAFRAAHRDDRAVAQRMSYLDLHLLGERQFDGAYSNMGGLNCTDDLRTVADGLATHVKPGGYFIATVMPRFCLWETAAFLLRGHPVKAFRRGRGNGVLAHLHGGTVKTRYHSPRRFAEAFSRDFSVVRLTGLNVFTPPPNSPRAYNLFPRLMKMLERFDDRVAGIPLFSSMSDHYLIVLRRKGGDVRS